MSTFFEKLQSTTEVQRQQLLGASLVTASLAGDITLPQYVAYLCQAFHHVRHTVPLLMAAGSRLDYSQEWLREALAEYIDEERGHQEWILDDIEACGFARNIVTVAQPTPATELMVAYAYDTINRVSPVGFFGMVHVLENTSITVADQAADSIQKTLNLPDAAFSYLRSHGALDQSHVRFFADLMNRIDNAADQQIILHCAQMFYRLFAAVLDSVDASQLGTATPVAGEVAHGLTG